MINRDDLNNALELWMDAVNAHPDDLDAIVVAIANAGIDEPAFRNWLTDASEVFLAGYIQANPNATAHGLAFHSMLHGFGIGLNLGKENPNAAA